MRVLKGLKLSSEGIYFVPGKANSGDAKILETYDNYFTNCKD